MLGGEIWQQPSVRRTPSAEQGGIYELGGLLPVFSAGRKERK